MKARKQLFGKQLTLFFAKALDQPMKGFHSHDYETCHQCGKSLTVGEVFNDHCAKCHAKPSHDPRVVLPS